MLNDTQIRDRVTHQALIQPFDEAGLLHCRYNLRAARVFSPVMGSEQVIGELLPDGSERRVWMIEPTETVVIMTRERVRIPDDLVGEYGQLYRLAQKGLLLINTSIVEPGYEGPLSCVIVNLSRERITIEPESEIAKLTFHQLSAAPARVEPQRFTEHHYRTMLASAAARLPKSFMGIDQVSKDVSDKVNDDVKKSLAFGGGIVVLLLIIATLQPWISGLIYERYPISAGDVAQLKSQVDDITTRLNAAESAQSSSQAIAALRAEVKAQAQEIRTLEAKSAKP